MIHARTFTLGLMAFVACGPVDRGTGLVAPVNACSMSSCDSFVQLAARPVCRADRDTCEAPNSLDFTLVISLPETSIFAPGRTFVTKYSTLELNKCGGAPPIPGCTKLLPLGEIAGVYVAPNREAELVNFNLGGADRSVPVRASFRPAWRFSDTGPLVDVGLLGMDLEPIFAPPATDQGFFPPPVGTAEGAAGSIGFDAALPFGAYEETLMPTPPFDRAFPPWTRIAIVDKGPLLKRDPCDFSNARLGLPQPKADQRCGVPPAAKETLVVAHAVDVTRGGGLILDGWSLFLRDDRTKRRISSLAQLTEQATVNLFTVGQADPDPISGADTIRENVELVLAPPSDGPRLPDLVLQRISNAVPAHARYPLLPPPVTVRGIVAADEDKRVPASIVLEATELTILKSGSDLDPSVKPTDLRFLDELSTTAEGTFERTLPPGKYKAIITPPPESGYAKTIADLEVSAPARAGEFQDGKTLRVKKVALLRGTCRVADGRVLVNAEVEAHASATLLYPQKGQDPTNPNDQDARPRRWPRTAVFAPTGEKGEFALPVDPNSMFDLVIRPAAGTRLPWRIVTEVKSPDAGESVVIDVEVPAPLIVSAVFHDPSDNIPVARALVRALVGRCVGPKETCASPAGRWVALELGRSRTDETGKIDLYLDGRPSH